MRHKRLERRAAETAKAITDRREELRMNFSSVHAAGGPSRVTQREWEGGNIPFGAHYLVKAKYEKALRWPVGHVDKLLSGEVQVPETVPRAVDMDVWVVSSKKLREMMGQINELRNAIETDPDITWRVRCIARELTTLQADLLMEVVSGCSPAQENAGTDEIPTSAGPPAKEPGSARWR
ncbi:hypothetical protein ACFVH4_25605 [Nocardia ignorata]|uniref:hypothetical protein n=1 Tax=Nocardia ignorata TaxID=145285 RepID=UPI003629B5CA